RGDHPSWTVYIQVLTEEDAKNYKYDIFDVTKVISQKDFPLQEVGRFVLDRNPENYFAEVEQAAFSPSHMVPGIAPSPDRMLQGRLFSYPDTHRHRLGANYLQLPINRPQVPVRNQQRDGPMTLTNNGGRLPNYEPNSFGGPQQRPAVREIDSGTKVEGFVGRHSYELTDADFEQPRALYNLLSESEKQDLVNNIAADISGAQLIFQRNIVPHLKRIHEDYGGRVEEILQKINPEY
ncbi:catalase A, partial [Coemansia sp. Benny D115]